MIVGLVLSGGRNTRLPVLKGLLDVGGQSIVERNLALMREATGAAWLSTNEPERYFEYGAPMVGDVVSDCGPMGGIYSAFIALPRASALLVCGCDMPFIKPRVLRMILSEPGGDVVVPVFDGEPQPLLALYRASAIGAMKAALLQGRYGLRRVLRELDAVYLKEDDIRSVDPQGESFININTPEDYARAFGRQLH